MKISVYFLNTSQVAGRTTALFTELYLRQACVQGLLICTGGMIFHSHLQLFLISRRPWPEPKTSAPRHNNTERETLKVNLAARGKNTAQVCTKHMRWTGDYLSIAITHLKDAQDGSNAIKKLPWSIYCNPIPVTGFRPFDRSLLPTASERTPTRLLHLTHTGATMSVSSCISTRIGQTCFTQRLRARWMVSMQPSGTQLFTRETTNTRERKPSTSKRKTIDIKCCDLRYVTPLETHLATISALLTSKS